MKFAGSQTFPIQAPVPYLWKLEPLTTGEMFETGLDDRNKTRKYTLPLKYHSSQSRQSIS